MEEIWKDIYGFEGYQVSNLGRVKNLNFNHTTGKERILKPLKFKDGYLLVGLYKNGKRHFKLIHRLVAEAFIPNDDLFKTEINHLDEDKENNNVNNLEWCTKSYNNNYGTKNKRVSKTLINHPKKSKQVNQYSLDGNFIRSFPSMAEIQRQLGYSQGHISACCNGKQKSAYGFIWKYA